MSGLIHSEGRTDFAQGNGKSYVSTKAFNLEFFTYTVSMNASFQQVGTLAYVTGADASNCPAGRVLQLTGRKLYPNINPMNTFVGTILTSPKFLVSVYDPITFLTGFIDPSSSTFAKYDQNLPGFFDQGPTANGSSIPPLGGQAGKLTVADAGDLTDNTATGASSLEAGDASVGALIIPNGAAVGTHTITINSTAVKSSSRIFFTQITAGTANLTSVVGPTAANGSFVVVAVVSTAVTAAAVKYNWLVVN